MEVDIIKNIAIQTPAFALIGILLYVLVRYLMRILDSREKRIDEMTDSFYKVVTNHLHESKEQSQKLTDVIGDLKDNVKTNTEMTRRVFEKI